MTELQKEFIDNQGYRWTLAEPYAHDPRYYTSTELEGQGISEIGVLVKYVTQTRDGKWEAHAVGHVVPGRDDDGWDGNEDNGYAIVYSGDKPFTNPLAACLAMNFRHLDIGEFWNKGQRCSHF
jgi:hypothetical protein